MAVLALAFALLRVIMVVRPVVKDVKVVVRMGAQLPVAVVVGKGAADHVEIHVLHHVKPFVVIIASHLVLALALVGARVIACLVVAATVVETALVLARADVVMDALDALFRFLASALGFDVSD
ncbi:MAG: hypothetical protein IKW97_02825 [Muribaculaceae bacterium]|nr:hypothetical protein [Muribaculaceae bacterium]